MDKIKLHPTIRPIAEPRVADKMSRKGAGEAQRFAETLKAELNRPQPASRTAAPDAIKTLLAEVEKTSNETAKLLLRAGDLNQRFFQQVKHGLHPTTTPTDDPDKA